MNLAGVTAETIAKVQAVLAGIYKDPDLHKAVDLSTGLTGYNLEAPAKLLVPLLSPFRQSIGRRTIPGTGTNWKDITSVTPTGGLKAAEATKSQGITYGTNPRSASYLSYGRLGSVTWEGNIAGRNYEDARAREETLVLLHLLREEEAAILGGFTGTALAGSPTITATAATSGGALADDQYFFMIVSLTMSGAIRAGRILRPTRGTNKYDFLAADGQTFTPGDGHGTVSAQANATVTGGGGAGQITLSWTPDPQAVAYLVYAGLTTGAANLKLQGCVTQSEVIMTSLGTTGAAANATGMGTDTSNISPINGIIPQLVASGSGAKVVALGGPLSAAVGRGIPEIDDVLNDIYDRTKEEPDRMVMGWQEHEAIDNLLASVSDDRVKLMVNVTGDISGGVLPRFDSYKTPRGKVIPMEENSNMPGGGILFLKDRIEIPNSAVSSPWEMHMGSPLVRLDYAMTAPKDEFEVRGFGALAGYASSFQGYMYDIHVA